MLPSLFLHEGRLVLCGVVTDALLLPLLRFNLYTFFFSIQGLCCLFFLPVVFSGDVVFTNCEFIHGNDGRILVQATLCILSQLFNLFLSAINVVDMLSMRVLSIVKKNSAPFVTIQLYAAFPPET